MFRLATMFGAALAAMPAAAMVGGAGAADPAAARHVVVVAGRGLHCSGVAIAADLVLTAAHCVRRAPDFRVVVRDGGRAVSKRIEAAAAHPQYASFQPRRDAPDLALIKLAPDAGLAAAKLSDRRATISAGERFLAVGFGMTDRAVRKPSETARAARLMAASLPRFQQVRLVDPATFGDRPGLGACNGDSGGPVFEETQAGVAVVGIMSWANDPADEGDCGYTTGVVPLARWHNWITDTAAQLGSPLPP